MHEFRTSTLEQKRILFDVFDRLTSLQAWAVGEISWLDTIVFYVSSIIVSYVVTATLRTQEARIWIFIITVNAVVSQFLQDNEDQLEVFKRNLYWWIWIWQCRKVMIAICVVCQIKTLYQLWVYLRDLIIHVYFLPFLFGHDLFIPMSLFVADTETSCDSLTSSRDSTAVSVPQFFSVHS
jgi:hypothetical protein